MKRVRIVLVLLFPAVALAGDRDPTRERRPITANLENVGPETARKMLEKAGGLRMQIAPQAAEWNINLRLIGVPTHQALTDVAKKFRCELRLVGKKRWHLAPAWQFRILDRLDKKMSVALEGNALDAIAAAAGVNITLDRTVSEPPVLKRATKKKSYRSLLDAVCKKAKLSWDLRYGVLYVAGKARLEALPVLTPRWSNPEQRAKLVSPALKNVALRKAELPVVVPDEFGDRVITAQARNITTAQALALALYPAGLTCEERDKKLHVRARK